MNGIVGVDREEFPVVRLSEGAFGPRAGNIQGGYVEQFVRHVSSLYERSGRPAMGRLMRAYGALPPGVSRQLVNNLLTTPGATIFRLEFDGARKILLYLSICAVDSNGVRVVVDQPILSMEPGGTRSAPLGKWLERSATEQASDGSTPEHEWLRPLADTLRANPYFLTRNYRLFITRFYAVLSIRTKQEPYDGCPQLPPDRCPFYLQPCIHRAVEATAFEMQYKVVYTVKAVMEAEPPGVTGLNSRAEPPMVTFC